MFGGVVVWSVFNRLRNCLLMNYLVWFVWVLWWLIGVWYLIIGLLLVCSGFGGMILWFLLKLFV